MSTDPEYGSPPAYPSPPVSQPAMATTSNVTVVKTAPAPVTYVSTMGPSPNNYKALNVFTLLCCCLPFGLIGLMYSNKVDSEWSSGNHREAYGASQKARGWGIAGIITGIITQITIVVVIVVLQVMSANNAASDDNN